MAITENSRVRALIGEAIPVGGTEADTLFTDEQIDDLLTRHTTVSGSLAEAWQMKAAALSDMVDVKEGDSAEHLSQMHKQALEMVKHYSNQGGVGQPVTRITKIIRPGWFQG